MESLMQNSPKFNENLIKYSLTLTRAVELCV